MKETTDPSRSGKSTAVLVALITAVGVVVAAGVAVLPNILQNDPEPAPVESRSNITGGSSTAITVGSNSQVVNGSTVHGNVIQNAKPEAKDPAQRIREEIDSLQVDKAKYEAEAQKARLASAKLPKDEAERSLIIANEYDRQASTIAAVMSELETKAKAFDAAKGNQVSNPSEVLPKP